MTELTEHNPLYDRLRDHYGDDDEGWSKQEIIELVETDSWNLSEGRAGQICVRNSTGRIIKGSVAPISMESYSYSDIIQEIRGMLAQTVIENNLFDRWLSSLMEQVESGDPRALKLFSDCFLGRPPEIGTHVTLSSSKVDLMFAQALNPAPRRF